MKRHASRSLTRWERPLRKEALALHSPVSSRSPKKKSRVCVRPIKMCCVVSPPRIFVRDEPSLMPRHVPLPACRPRHPRQRRIRTTTNRTVAER
jgi:hypothetical protein